MGPGFTRGPGKIARIAQTRGGDARSLSSQNSVNGALAIATRRRSGWRPRLRVGQMEAGTGARQRVTPSPALASIVQTSQFRSSCELSHTVRGEVTITCLARGFPLAGGSDASPTSLPPTAIRAASPPSKQAAPRVHAPVDCPSPAAWSRVPFGRRC